MIKLLTIFLFVCLSQSLFANMFEERMEFAVNNLLLTAGETDLIGEGEFNRVLFANEYTNISLKPGQTLHANALITSKYIYLTDGNVDYYFPNVMNLTSETFKRIEAGKTAFTVYNNVLKLTSEVTEVEGIDFYLKALMFDINCFLEDNSVDFERCFNNAEVKSLSPDESIKFTFKNPTSSLYIDTNDITITPKQYHVQANRLDFNHDKFKLNIHDTTLSCNKNKFTTDMEGSEFFNGCLEYGHLDKGTTTITIPEHNIVISTQDQSIKAAENEFNFNVSSLNFNMDEKYSIQTDRTFFRCKTASNIDTKNEIDYKKMIIECANDMNSNVQNIHISNDDLNVDMEHFQYITENGDISKIHSQIRGITGNCNTYYFNIPQLRASCNSIQDFNMSMLVRDCLMDGDIHIPTIDFNDEETDLKAKIKISEATIKNNNFVVKSPVVSIKMPTITATISNLEASCRRDEDDDPLNFELLQRRCFENSLLKIPLIEASNDKYDLKIAVRDISIDKSQLLLNIPKASYELNKTGIYFEGMNFVCNPNVTFENFKELNIKNIVDNCVNNTQVTIKAVKNLTSFGNKRTKYKKVGFFSRNSNFTLKLKTSILLVPTNVKFQGSISYNTNTSQIVLDIKKASAGWLFGKKIILFFMNNFFEDKNIKIDGNKISLTLDDISKSDKHD